MYIIRYSINKKGSGMMNVTTNEAAKEELKRLSKKGEIARCEKNGIVVGESYKQTGKWYWYIDNEA